MTCYGVVLAGGAGRRMGGEEPKQFMRGAGRPVLAYALAAFESCGAILVWMIVATGSVSD